MKTVPMRTAPSTIRYRDLSGFRQMLGEDDGLMLGMMCVRQPFELVGEYAVSMMAGLVFHDLDTLPDRHAMQLGLGPGALSKFCWGRLGMRVTAVELDPDVARACRDWFLLPPDNDRLRVVLADAGAEIAKPDYQCAVDLLHVDLYDGLAMRPALDTHEFWTDCRNSLTEDGCMTVNLFGRCPSWDLHVTVERIAAAFGKSSIWLVRMGSCPNVVLMARREPMPSDMSEIMATAAAIAEKTGVPAPQLLTQLQCVL